MASNDRPTTVSGATPAAARASLTAPATPSQRFSPSCSAWSGSGRCRAIGRSARPSIRPARSNTPARALPVPTSTATTTGSRVPAMILHRARSRDARHRPCGSAQMCSASAQQATPRSTPQGGGEGRAGRVFRGEAGSETLSTPKLGPLSGQLNPWLLRSDRRTSQRDISPGSYDTLVVAGAPSKWSVCVCQVETARRMKKTPVGAVRRC